jgi:hypothetical protein
MASGIARMRRLLPGIMLIFFIPLLVGHHPPFLSVGNGKDGGLRGVPYIPPASHPKRFMAMAWCESIPEEGLTSQSFRNKCPAFSMVK